MVSSLLQKKLLFHPLLPLMSLVILWINLYFQSIVLGVICSLLFFCPNISILKRILYSEHKENPFLSSFLSTDNNF